MKTAALFAFELTLCVQTLQISIAGQILTVPRTR